MKRKLLFPQYLIVILLLSNVGTNGQSITNSGAIKNIYTTPQLPQNALMSNSTDNLIAHYVFDIQYASDAGKDSITEDYSGRNNILMSNFNLITNSNRTDPLYPNGMALYFNGSSNHMGRDTAVDNDFEVGDSSFSFEAIYSTEDNGRQFICSKHHYSTGDPAYMFLVKETNGYLSTKIADSSDNNIQIYSNSPVNDGAWHYGVAVIDYDKHSVFLYNDGSQVGKSAFSASTRSLTDPSSYFTVGGIQYDNDVYYWHGYLAELRFSKRALTASEISAHWDSIQAFVPVAPPISTITALSNSPGSIDLIMRNAHYDSIFVYRDTTPNPTKYLTSLAYGDTTYNDTSVTEGVIYYYRYKYCIYDFNGNSILSDYSSDASDTVKGSLVTIGKVRKNFPVKFELFQNHPNPFNPSTTIEYAIPFESSVDITIYSMTGQRVKEFKEGVKEAGYYNISWQPEDLSSGVYLYSINAKSIDGKNNYSKTLKMVYIR